MQSHDYVYCRVSPIPRSIPCLPVTGGALTGKPRLLEIGRFDQNSHVESMLLRVDTWNWALLKENIFNRVLIAFNWSGWIARSQWCSAHGLMVMDLHNVRMDLDYYCQRIERYLLSRLWFVMLAGVRQCFARIVYSVVCRNVFFLYKKLK